MCSFKSDKIMLANLKPIYFQLIQFESQVLEYFSFFCFSLLFPFSPRGVFAKFSFCSRSIWILKKCFLVRVTPADDLLAT